MRTGELGSSRATAGEEGATTAGTGEGGGRSGKGLCEEVDSSEKDVDASFSVVGKPPDMHCFSEF